MYIVFFLTFLHISWFILVIWVILRWLHFIQFFYWRLHFKDIGHLVTWDLSTFRDVLVTVQQKTFLSMFTYWTVSCGLLYAIMKIKYKVRKIEKLPPIRANHPAILHKIFTFMAIRKDEAFRIKRANKTIFFIGCSPV